MSHHIHTTTLRTTTSFLLVLLINQHTINHHTLATLLQDTLGTLYHHTLATYQQDTLAILHHPTLDTLHSNTLVTLHQDTNTHLSMLVFMDTHHLPSSHQLIVHQFTSILELKYNNQVIKVTFVALKLCFHTKFWGRHRNTLCTGLWWSLSIENEYMY